MKIIYCNKCKKEISKEKSSSDHWVTLRDWTGKISNIETRWDLCEDCFKELVNWTNKE